MITTATQKTTAGLKKIMKKSFGDPDDYIDFLVSNGFNLDCTYVYTDNEKPVSMLTLMPAKLLVRGKYRLVNYVYAVATLPAYRGQGISTRLLEYVNNFSPNKAEATFLHPADSGLFNFYERQSYKTAFYIKEINIGMDDINIQTPLSFEIKTASCEEYKAVRDMHFEREGYINWDIDAIKFALLENEFLEGKSLLIDSGKRRDVILYWVYEKKLIVRETTIDDENLLFGAVKEIISKENAINATIRLHPENSINAGEAVKFAMIYGGDLGAVCGYCNLTLD